MIIFREKLFRRDEITEEVYEDLMDKPELVEKYGPSSIKISASKEYNKQMATFGPAINKTRIKALLRDIKAGHLTNDGPNGGDTHYLGDYSKMGKSHVFSKAIDETHRLNIRVHCPGEAVNPQTHKTEHLKIVVLESCWEHNINEGDYMDPKLKAKKDLKRKSAPYRKDSGSTKKGMNIKRLRK